MAMRTNSTDERPARPALRPVPDWASVRPAVTDELLRGIAARIVERFQPDGIWLFGSYAYGQPTIYSDVDLFVVMESGEPFLDRVRKVHEVAQVPYLPMDIIVSTPAEVQQRLEMGDHFIAEILRKGVPLYERARRVDREGGGGLPISG